MRSFLSVMTGKMILPLLAVLFATASALPLSDLEEWTNAIRLHQTDKVNEQLQTPRNLLDQFEEKFGKIRDAQYNFQEDLVGYLVANKTIDKKAGYDVLEKFADEWFSLSLDHEVEDALQWFNARCSDAVTPVSGDLRVQLEKAKNGFLDQLEYLNGAQKGFSLLRKGLEPLVTRDDPESRRAAIQLVETFFGYFERGLSTERLIHVQAGIEDFYQLWKEKKSGKREDIHKTAVKEWTEAIQAGDKQKVRDLTEVPRALFKKAYEKGKQAGKIIGPLKLEFGKFIFNETVDKMAAFQLLNVSLISLDHLKLDSDLPEAEEWFDKRSWDEITPVSGDARAWFKKAGDAFHRQKNDLFAIKGSPTTISYWLASLMDPEGPEVERMVRNLWPVFYAGIGLRTGVDALLHFEDDLDNFFKAWHPV